AGRNRIDEDVWSSRPVECCGDISERCFKGGILQVLRVASVEISIDRRDVNDLSQTRRRQDEKLLSSVHRGKKNIFVLILPYLIVLNVSCPCIAGIVHQNIDGLVCLFNFLE